jgi:misacylated tRNA(Ala) deacylase
LPAKLLYQIDSYMREFDATITRIDGNKVFLDQTAFHPRPSGGLDADHGKLVLPDGSEIPVVDVYLESGDVAHVIENGEGLGVGMRVHGVIDWERRYRMMKLHTASHIVIAILHDRYGVKVTGGHITPEMARDDLDIQVENWKDVVREAFEEANRIMRRCIEVKVYWLPREEALKIPGIVKLADKLPPEVERLRIVEIPGVDIQADGGPHVRNTCEIPGVRIVKLESRGRRRKRVYYTLAE